MTQTIALKCPHCGATGGKSGQPFKNQSGLNTHINMHCEKKPKPTEHKHKWALLNPNLPDHARAMNHGHTKYCTDSKCGEVE